ncbi:MAG: FAD-binding protein, partial [Asticcacaulis sp.]
MPTGEIEKTARVAGLLEGLRSIVGAKQVLTEARAMRRYCTGFRSGGGGALAVVRPSRLTELWRVLKLCVEADVIVLPQAANTGLTGGSVPATGYDRDVVVISTARIKGIFPVRDGQQVVCLPGAT